MTSMSIGMLCCLLTSRNCSQRTVYSLRLNGEE